MKEFIRKGAFLMSQKTYENLVDMVRIHDIFGNDKHAVHEFFNSFVDNAKTLITDIKFAIKSKDEKLAKDSFHRLKGSAGNSGVMLIHQLCLKAEDRVLAHDWNEADNLLKEIENTFKKIQERVAEHSI
jgi:HPt (histidine-containing phosphotransfer) domain-containing protein